MGCGGSKVADDKPSGGSPAPAKAAKGKEAASNNSASASGGGGAAAAAAAAKEKDPITPGNVEDFYTLEKEIGKGGFSVVFAAKKKSSGERFAIKRIRKNEEGVDVDLLKREIYIMIKVDHPNILKLFEVYEDDEHFFLVLELVDGSELFDKIVDLGNYSEKDAANIVRQIVSAVEYLHANGIVHRDLKPENLLSSGQGEQEVVKVADFGFAKNFGEEKLMTSCGSPGYVAPEVLTEDTYTNAVDMWSVGVIVYILLSGYPPFFDESPPKIFKKITEVKYDFEDPAWDGVSETAKDLIRKLLVKDPVQRLTATDTLKHPWLAGEATSTPLPEGSMIKFREYNKSRRGLQ